MVVRRPAGSRRGSSSTTPSNDWSRATKTTFIGVHFGNDPEDPDNVGRMLDKHPNLFIDTAARVPEIGRHPQEKMRRFYAKYQDRVLFGTDTGIGPTTPT